MMILRWQRGNNNSGGSNSQLFSTEDPSHPSSVIHLFLFRMFFLTFRFAYHLCMTTPQISLRFFPPHHLCYFACDSRSQRSLIIDNPSSSPFLELPLIPFLTTSFKVPFLVGSRSPLSLSPRTLVTLFSLRYYSSF